MEHDNTAPAPEDYRVAWMFGCCEAVMAAPGILRALQHHHVTVIKPRMETDIWCLRCAEGKRWCGEGAGSCQGSFRHPLMLQIPQTTVIKPRVGR